MCANDKRRQRIQSRSGDDGALGEAQVEYPDQCRHSMLVFEPAHGVHLMHTLYHHAEEMYLRKFCVASVGIVENTWGHYGRTRSENEGVSLSCRRRQAKTFDALVS